MMRRLKVIGLSALAVLAVSAVSASAANAAEGTAVVTGGGGYTATQVEGGHTFLLFGGRSLSCAKATFSGTVANGSKTVTATPVYDECHTKVGETTLVAHVVETSCDYVFSDLTTSGTNTYAAKTEVNCPGSQAIHITVTNEKQTGVLCEYTVGTQSGLTGVSFKDNANNTLNITATNVGVSMTRTQGTIGNCGATPQTATYNGNTLATPAVGTTIDIDD